MCLKNFCGIVHRHRDDRTSGFAGNFETSLMERKEFQFILVFVPGSFWEDADGDAGFDLFNSGKDGFQSLFDILTIQKQAMQIAHPVGKKRISFHFFLCNITGTDRAATVGKYNVKVASVITNIKDWCVFWDIFFTDYRDLGSGFPQNKLKTAWIIRRELISFVRGENFPMIHSTKRIGIDKIRNPMTVMATITKRIIMNSSFCQKDVPHSKTLVQV